MPQDNILYGDYRDDVLRAYEACRSEPPLSAYLLRPTPAKLRDACLLRIKEPLNRSDEHWIRTFFGLGKEVVDFASVIKRFDPDRFKPLVNFLKEKTSDTEEKNLELLAWLIDYQSRPLELARKRGLEKERPAISPPLGPVPTNHSQVPNENAKTIAGLSPGTMTPPIRWKKRILIVSILSVALVIVVYLFAGRNTWDGKGNRSEGCMYWTGTEYKQTSCTPKGGDTLAIALNPELLENFRKITRLDTVTRYSIGKLWYVRLNGGIELYTMKAPYPVGKSRSFFRLSRYMYEKHIEPLHIK